MSMSEDEFGGLSPELARIKARIVELDAALGQMIPPEGDLTIRIAELEAALRSHADGWRTVNFFEAIKIAEDGLFVWATKPHNAKKWARKLEGTPIPNDICVAIAEEMIKAGLSLPSPPVEEETP